MGTALLAIKSEMPP